MLLPGADARQAAILAEDLRETVLAERHGGLSGTMSFGVSASQPSSFDYEHAFEQADRALYAAKAAGRNRVRIAGGVDLGVTVLEPSPPLAPEAVLCS